MSVESTLSVRSIRAVFEEEIADLGGTVPDVFDDGNCLYARGVLPPEREVGPDDRVRGGVAVRACEGCLDVFPYVFRKVCSNGLIMASALQAWQLENVAVRAAEEAAIELREAVRACASEEAFADAAGCMRSAHGSAESHALMMLAHFSGRNRAGGSPLLREVLMRRQREPERSAFGVMNAVTSTARDTKDPARRWRLEELGGAIAASSVRPRPLPGLAAELARGLIDDDLLSADAPRPRRSAYARV